jgi:hypothetical protein
MDKDMDKEKDKQSILFPILPTSLWKGVMFALFYLR